MSEKVAHIIGSPAAERVLVAGLLRGDAASYRQLYDVFGPPLRRSLLRLLRDRTLADDAVQAAFLIVFRRVETFDHRASLLSWITRIGIHEGLRLARAANKLSLDVPEVESANRSPEAEAILAQQGARVGALIAALPDAKRVPLLLFEIEGFSVAEIADLIGEPRGTVLSRLSRTRAELRSALARRGAETLSTDGKRERKK